jgi:hypothetical protein
VSNDTPDVVAMARGIELLMKDFSIRSSSGTNNAGGHQAISAPA